MAQDPPPTGNEPVSHYTAGDEPVSHHTAGDGPVILCAGEALIDMVPRATAQGEEAFLPLPGGAVFNTAIAAARLGARVMAFHGLSHDLFGDMLRRALREAGVDSALCATSARPTTLAFVTLTDGQARYLFLDENTAGRMLTPADLPAIPDAVRAVFLGGISLAVEPCAGAMEALCERAAAHGDRLIMIDPNIRPGFIADEPAFRARLERMMGRAHVVKVSDEDLRWLEGAGEIADLARAVQARGPRLVLVTRGAEGAVAFGAGVPVHRPAPPARVADTVGAGDTFNAGILTALAEAGALSPEGVAALSPEALADCLDLAIRAAGVTVTRVGANPPWRHEI